MIKTNNKLLIKIKKIGEKYVSLEGIDYNEPRCSHFISREKCASADEAFEKLKDKKYYNYHGSATYRIRIVEEIELYQFENIFPKFRNMRY